MYAIAFKSYLKKNLAVGSEYLPDFEIISKSSPFGAYSMRINNVSSGFFPGIYLS